MSGGRKRAAAQIGGRSGRENRYGDGVPRGALRSAAKRKTRGVAADGNGWFARKIYRKNARRASRKRAGGFFCRIFACRVRKRLVDQLFENRRRRIRKNYSADAGRRRALERKRAVREERKGGRRPVPLRGALLHAGAFGGVRCAESRGETRGTGAGFMRRSGRENRRACRRHAGRGDSCLQRTRAGAGADSAFEHRAVGREKRRGVSRRNLRLFYGIFR